MTDYAQPEALVSTDWVADTSERSQGSHRWNPTKMCCCTKPAISPAHKRSTGSAISTIRSCATIWTVHTSRHCRAGWASPPTRPSCCTATRTTGGRPMPVGLQAVRPRRRAHPERWPQEVDRRRPRAHQGSTDAIRRRSTRPRSATTRDSRVPRRSTRFAGQGRAGRCALARRVQRQEATYAGISRRKAHCAAVIFQPRRAFHGRRQPTRMAPSSHASNLNNCTAARASPQTRM